MDIKYAKQILNKTVLDYNKIGDKYSRVREKDWPEMDFLFDKYLSKGELVLDFGCGNGRFYNSIKKYTSSYFGVDPSSKLIEIAKGLYPNVNFSVSLIDSIPFDDNYFDKVYSIAVLHHIPSRELRLNLLKEIKRALKDNSYLILTVWNLKEKMKPRNIWDWFKNRKLDSGDVFLPWYGSDNTYFHCFNLEELVQLVKDSGFEIIDQGEILVGLKPYSNFYIVAKK